MAAVLGEPHVGVGESGWHSVPAVRWGGGLVVLVCNRVRIVSRCETASLSAASRCATVERLEICAYF